MQVAPLPRQISRNFDNTTRRNITASLRHTEHTHTYSRVCNCASGRHSMLCVKKIGTTCDVCLYNDSQKAWLEHVQSSCAALNMDLLLLETHVSQVQPASRPYCRTSPTSTCWRCGKHQTPCTRSGTAVGCSSQAAYAAAFTPHKATCRLNEHKGRCELNWEPGTVRHHKPNSDTY